MDRETAMKEALQMVRQLVEKGQVSSDQAQAETTRWFKFILAQVDDVPPHVDPAEAEAELETAEPPLPKPNPPKHAGGVEGISTEERLRLTVHENGIECLECGAGPHVLFATHLKRIHGTTPEAYRERWDLPADYPMTTTAYAAKKRVAANEQRLGKTIRAFGADRVSINETLKKNPKPVRIEVDFQGGSLRKTSSTAKPLKEVG